MTIYTYTLEILREGYRREYYHLDSNMEFVNMPHGCFECEEHDERIERSTVIESANKEIDEWGQGISASVIERAITIEDYADGYGDPEYCDTEIYRTRR